MIYDIMIATALTNAIGRRDLKEVQLEGGRYNVLDRGYFHRRLPNESICMKRSLWYCHDC